MEAEMGGFKGLGALQADRHIRESLGVLRNFVFQRTISNMLWLRCRLGEGKLDKW